MSSALGEGGEESRVVCHRLVGDGTGRKEGIVQGMEEKGRDPDPAEELVGATFPVIIRRILEAVQRPRGMIVEFDDGFGRHRPSRDPGRSGEARLWP